ncbi:hypothetical protein ACLOJK_039753 [Asimina triloba]
MHIAFPVDVFKHLVSYTPAARDLLRANHSLTPNLSCNLQRQLPARAQLTAITRGQKKSYCKPSSLQYMSTYHATGTVLPGQPGHAPKGDATRVAVQSMAWQCHAMQKEPL